MTKKTVKKDKGLVPTMVQKSQKVNEYIYVLSNGSEISFKDKNFPIEAPKILNNGQLLIF